ncbi:MAG: hypothetical protein JJ992_26010 [Planctomycetes bacterium]|nr:hypothetical protein [Planctomycetota bacterium]
MFTQLALMVVLVSGQFSTEPPAVLRDFDASGASEQPPRQDTSLGTPTPSFNSDAESAQQPPPGDPLDASPGWGSIYSRAVPGNREEDARQAGALRAAGDAQLALPTEPAAVIEPLANEAPLAPVDSASVASAVQLVRGVLRGNGDRPLDGQGVKLSDILTGIPGGEQRKHAALAYWRLAHHTAAHRFCTEETDLLFNLAIPQSVTDRALLTSWQASVKADEAQARLAAVRAQYALAAMKPNFGDANLPLPADLPFVGIYETQFETFRSRGVVSEQLAQINATLPLMHDLLERQADAVYATDAAVRELQQGYHAGQVSFHELLDGFEQLRRHRREFLASVLEYNESIADYALDVASSNLPVDRVVGMLIEVTDSQRSVLASRRELGAIRRVSNEAEVDAGQRGSSDRQPRLNPVEQR